MKRRELIEGRISRIEYPGKGILEAGDVRVVVKNALPGQKVRCRITKVHGDRAEAELLEILEEAGDSVESACLHFGKCGGCTYLTVPYVKELGIKEQQVRGIIFPVIGRQKEHFTWEGIKTSPIRFGYRNKMEFTFGDEEKDGPLALGMHRRGSMHDIVTVTGCRIVDDDFRMILSGTLEYFSGMYARGEVSYYHRVRQTGYLRHLLVRKAAKTGEILIDLVTTTQEEHDLAPFCEKMLGLTLRGTITGILHTRNDSVSDAVKDEGTEILYGRDYYNEVLLGMSFRVSTFSFFQTNSLSAEVLYETVRDYILSLDDLIKPDAAYYDDGSSAVKKHVIMDLYCGTGTIAQIIAPVAEKVIGVEIVPEAVQAARENTAANKLKNVTFYEGDVGEVLEKLSEKPDIIVLDPPRDGVHPKALRRVIELSADNIVYVSCKPTSLARDLEPLLAGGYYVRRAVALDQFPWTQHVETCVLLSKSNASTD